MNATPSCSKLALSMLTLLAASALACGAKTTLSSVWRASDYATGAMDRLLVIAVTENQGQRRAFEDRFAEALASKEVAAVPSYERLPSPARLERADIEKVLRSGDFDGVVITRLLAVDKETTYVPPQTHVVPGAYWGYGYYGYYGYSWDVVHTPGYYVTTQIVRLETNLYDGRTGNLVWSAQSDTFDPKSADDVIESATKAISKRLAQDALLPNG